MLGPGAATGRADWPLEANVAEVCCCQQPGHRRVVVVVDFVSSLASIWPFDLYRILLGRMEACTFTTM
jgi:hypothetical protein